MTKTEVLTRFGLMFPDCDSTLAGQLFDESHREIMADMNIRSSSVVISLTAGTREYTLSASAYRITEAYYQPSSTASTWRKLSPVSIEQLAERGNWRAQSQQVIPTEYYITTAVSGNTAILDVGFVQIPPSTTSGSYPNVTLYGEFIVDLSGSDSLSGGITYTDVYPYWMAKKFVTLRMQDMNEIAKWKKLADDQLDENKENFKGFQFGNEGLILRPSHLNTMTRRR